MPELPDVEQFKRYFKKVSLNKRIIDIECGAKELIKEITFKDFKKKLINKRFKDAKRRGKFLIITVEEIPEKLILHFAMTGNLHYAKQGKPKIGPDRFARLIFRFDNGYELRWLNMRRLGRIYLVKNPTDIKLIKELGSEPLELKRAEFLKLLASHRNKNIKAFLLDQRDIAGIGNVYSDEMLFRTRISPHRKISSLNSEQEEEFYHDMKKVLNDAIQINTSSKKSFDSSWIIPHRNKDMRCPRNRHHTLKREIIATRGCIFCPICQK